MAAFPVILNGQSAKGYNLYEYSIVICIIFAAIVDIAFAALDREYLNDSTSRSMVYTYLLICSAAVLYGGANIPVMIVIFFLLAASLVLFIFVRHNSISEFAKSIPLAAASVLCAWAFVTFALK